MKIHQFIDQNLAHFSYAILSRGEIALVDPGRNPQPYYDFANEHNAQISAIIETHPHADFISGHLELSATTGAPIYISKLVGAEFPHQTFDEGDAILLGEITLKAINTPGHSPDSICIIAIDQNGKYEAVFTGDTLFAGDCGRPDLRETAGAITASRIEMAKQMYYSLHGKLMNLPDDTALYPAHGSGSLCGKALSSKTSSTIGEEKRSNWSLQDLNEENFVAELLKDQAYIPKYFPFDVALNKKGAPDYAFSISNVRKRSPVKCQGCVDSLNPEILIIDTRPQHMFKKSHLKNAINLMNNLKFETWLGSIVNPGQKFYLLAENDSALSELIERIAKIGYENQIELAFVSTYGNAEMPLFDSSKLKENAEAFTIVDIRSNQEAGQKKFFQNAINIPLPELLERVNEIPDHKPILVHCAGGYRSAAGSSIIKSKINCPDGIFDLSEAINQFQS